MELTAQFVNNSGVPDNQVYVAVIARNAGGTVCYLNAAGVLVPVLGGQNVSMYSMTLNSFSALQFPPIMTSARLWISYGVPMNMPTFAGGGIAQPNLGNPGDPNINTRFDWMEFNVGGGQVFANTTQVDMFGIPYTMELYNDSGLNSIRGIPGCYDDVAAQYQSFMNSIPGASIFNSLVGPVRIVAPAHGSFGAGQPNGNYFNAYISSVWPTYGMGLPTPSTQDVFLATGPLATQPQLNASLNRHVIDNPANIGNPAAYYQLSPANYYAAFWHQVNLANKAYGFAYDDANDQSSLQVSNSPRAIVINLSGCPATTPTRTPTPSRTRTFTPTASRSLTPTLTASRTPSSSLTLTRSQSPSPSRTLTSTPSLSPTGSATRTSSPSLTLTGTPSASSSATPSPTRTSSPTSTRTASGTPTTSLTVSFSSTRTATLTASLTHTRSATLSSTSSSTATPTASPSRSTTPTSSPSLSATGSFSPTFFASPTATPTQSLTFTLSQSSTLSSTSTATRTATPSFSSTPSSSSTRTLSLTPSSSPSVSSTRSSTASPSQTPSFSPSPSQTSTLSPSSTRTASLSASPSATLSLTSSLSASPSPSPTLTPSSSASPTLSVSASHSPTPTTSPRILHPFSFNLGIFSSSGEEVRALVRGGSFSRDPSDWGILDSLAVPESGDTAVIFAAGQTFLFDGRNGAGQALAPGSYYALLTVRDPFSTVYSYSGKISVLRGTEGLKLCVSNSAGEILKCMTGTAKIPPKWDGLDAWGQAPQSGTYALTLTEESPTGTLVKSWQQAVLNAPEMVPALSAGPNPWRLGGPLAISFGAGNFQAALYSLSGERVATAAGSLGRAEIRAQPSSGVYLLKCGKSVLKICVIR